MLAVPRDHLPAYTHENVVRRLTLTPRLGPAARRDAFVALYEAHLAANHEVPAVDISCRIGFRL